MVNQSLTCHFSEFRSPLTTNSRRSNRNSPDIAIPSRENADMSKGSGATPASNNNRNRPSNRLGPVARHGAIAAAEVDRFITANHLNEDQSRTLQRFASLDATQRELFIAHHVAQAVVTGKDLERTTVAEWKINTALGV